MGRMRSRFLRAVLETAHQETAGVAIGRLREGLPPHLRSFLQREVLAPNARDASVELEPAFDLLLSIDRVLCGGSGVVTTRVSSALASRVLSQSAGLVVPGDAVATLQHLRAPFEHPFIDAPLHFSARRLPDGFVLELHMGQELRAARWLGSAGLGYAKAATSFSGEGARQLRLYTELVGDLARVIARESESGVVSVSSAAPAPRESARPIRRRSAPTNAAARVDQILSRKTPSAGMPMPPLEARGIARPSSRPPSPPLGKTAGHDSGTRPAPGTAPSTRARKSGA
jgi:hypothetical protein